MPSSEILTCCFFVYFYYWQHIEIILLNLFNFDIINSLMSKFYY